jgi:hypothetical protein
MRNLVLAAVAGLVVASGLARADAPVRGVADRGDSETGDFEVIVMRGATISRVSGNDDGTLSEVTIREGSSPARSEEQEEPGRGETERSATRAVQVVVVERAYPVSVLRFLPERLHPFGSQRNARIRGGLPRPTPAGSVATLRAERGRTMEALAAGTWPATPSFTRFRKSP